MQGYLDDISRLKKLIPVNAALALTELESATRDRQRAQALLEESAVRSYDWDTKQVLKKLLQANDRIIKLECILKDPDTQSNQTDFLKMLQNAEVDQDQYMSLNLSMRQVLVKQCRAVNVRLNDLRTIIKSSERPRKEELLSEIYQVRGDEEAFYDEDDPEPEQVLKQLLNANTRIMKFERMLEDTETQPNQIVFSKTLLNAEVDTNRCIDI